MRQDTLTHTATTASPAASGEATASSAAVTTQTAASAPAKTLTVLPDTATTDPATLRPLAGNLPLTMKPAAFEQNYWADGLVHIERAPLVERLDSAVGRAASYTVTTPGGIAGEPVPYRLQDDNTVTIVLFVSFFLVAWVISRSKHFLNHQLRNFFTERTRPNLFTRDPENELRGRSVLIFQTCFTIGLLLFDFTRELMPEAFNLVSPHVVLGLYVGGFFLYFLTKLGLYRLVNSVFFIRDQVARWDEIYLLSVLVTGLGLFPSALLMIYFDLSTYALFIYSVCMIGLVKILLLYKCYSIFFKHGLGLLHLFLYFCTLEITPLLYLSIAVTTFNPLS